MKGKRLLDEESARDAAGKDSGVGEICARMLKRLRAHLSTLAKAFVEVLGIFMGNFKSLVIADENSVP